MRRENGIFILEETNTTSIKEKFQGFEGIILFESKEKPNVIQVKEGFYDKENFYWLSQAVAMFSINDIKKNGRYNDENIKEIVIKKAIILNIKIFKNRLPEIAVTESLAKKLNLC